MFRTVPLCIIRSVSLYTQQWYMSYRFADSCEQDHDGTVYCAIFFFFYNSEKEKLLFSKSYFDRNAGLSS